MPAALGAPNSMLQDRATAGRELATALAKYRARRDVLVLGMAPGGVPVAAEIAQALDAPLDVIVSKELTLPGGDGSVVGSVASGEDPL